VGWGWKRVGELTGVPRTAAGWARPQQAPPIMMLCNTLPYLKQAALA
jgi:hypothetical protein